MKYRVTYAVKGIGPSYGPRPPRTKVIECDERPRVDGEWTRLPGIAAPVCIESCHAVNLDPPNAIGPATTNLSQRTRPPGAREHENIRAASHRKHMTNLADAAKQQRFTHPTLETSVE